MTFMFGIGALLLGVAIGGEPEPPVPDPIGRDRAVAIALSRYPAGAARARLSVEPVGPELRQVWSVHLDRPATPRWIAPVVRLDARTGAVIDVYESAETAGPEALAYAHNPVVDAAPIPVALIDLEDGELRDARFTVFDCIDEGGATDTTAEDGTVWALRSCTERVALPPEGAPYSPVPWAADPARDEDLFVGPHLFWNVRRGLQWFDAKGWVPAADYDPTLDVVANYRTTDMLTWETAVKRKSALRPYDNAYATRGYDDFFDGWIRPRLVFGQGSSVDYGYDADTILHELTHAVVASVHGPRWNGAEPAWWGPRRQADALNEGLADYFSDAIQGDPRLAEYVRADSDSPLERDLSGFMSCGELVGEPHWDGQPFAQGLWQARTGLPGDDQALFDRAILSTLPALGPEATFEDAHDLILDAVAAQVGDYAWNRLDDAWRARGFGVDCVPVVDVEPGPVPVRPYTEIIAHSTEYDVSFFPGYVQFRFEVPEPGATVMVGGSQLEFVGLDLWDDNAPQPVDVFAMRGTGIQWTGEVVDVERDDGTINRVRDWRSTAVRVGRLELAGVRPHPDLPDRYLVRDYSLAFHAPAAGPWVIQFANTAERYVRLYDVTIDLAPPEQSGCACGSPGGGAPGMSATAVLALFGVRRRRSGRA